MPEINFDEIPDEGDYSPLPDGEYLCELQNIEERQTRHGDEMWGLEFVVIGEEYHGRKMFDNMVFSKKAMNRVKLICSRLGLETKGIIALTPKMITGNKTWLTIVTEDYVNKEGRHAQRNTVPFAGYRVVETGEVESGAKKDDQDLPF